MSIKGFIFDLDGTLADTIGDLRYSMNQMLTNNGHPALTRQQILSHINGGAYEFVRRSLPEAYQHDPDYDAARYEEYNKIYAAHYKDSTEAFPGIPETVAALKAAGIRLGVLSNKQHFHTNGLVDKLFPAGTFDMVLGHSNMPHKPDPTAALYIASVWGLSPKEIAFVGDSDVDMKTAHNSGMLAVAVTWGYRGRDVLAANGAQVFIDHAGEILSMVSAH